MDVILLNMDRFGKKPICVGAKKEGLQGRNDSLLRRSDILHPSLDTIS